MKNLLIFLIIGILVASCKRDIVSSSESLDAAESLLWELHEKNFTYEGVTGVNVSAAEIYSRAENYFLATGFLKAISQSDYVDFFNNTVLSDDTFNISCLRKVIPEVYFITNPSNALGNAYNFKKVGEQFDSELSKSHQFSPIAKCLENLYFKSNSKESVRNGINELLNEIDEESFKDNILYRAYLIGLGYRLLEVKKYSPSQ
jgi:hypothetical protein